MSDEPTLPGGQGQPAEREANELFGALYAELRRLAERELRRNGSITLSPTTLVHETYLSFSGRAAQFPDRSRFMAYAARAMRGLVIDHVRSRRAVKRGGQLHLTNMPTDVADGAELGAEVERIGEALEELEKIDPRLASLVDLRFFCGYSLSDAAELLSISERTAHRDWDKARLFLHARVRATEGKP